MTSQVCSDAHAPLLMICRSAVCVLEGQFVARFSTLWVTPSIKVAIFWLAGRTGS